jgi:hypothetical protein
MLHNSTSHIYNTNINEFKQNNINLLQLLIQQQHYLGLAFKSNKCTRFNDARLTHLKIQLFIFENVEISNPFYSILKFLAFSRVGLRVKLELISKYIKIRINEERFREIIILSKFKFLVDYPVTH